jgi:polyisoprenyl-teichoic acid--peptidoglycan teichoic acid transferase
LQDYVGYRTQKRKNKQNKKRAVWKWLVALAVIIVILVILGAAVKVYPFNRAWDKTVDGFTWLGRKIRGIFPKSKAPRPQQFLEEGKKTANYLIVVTDQLEGATHTNTVMLASYDSRDQSGSLIYLPTDIRVQVPGAGEDTLSNLVEIDDGRVGMTLEAVSNLLGVQIDRYVMGTDRDVRLVLSKIQPTYSVEVPSKVTFTDGGLKVTVNFSSGRHDLTASQTAAYVTFAQEGKELDLIKRQMSFAPEFLSVSRSIFGEIPSLTARYAGLVDTSASDRQLTGFWQAFSLLKGDKLQQATVPVKEIRIEKSTMHMLDTARLEAFEKKYIKSDSALSSRLRVEILNGNGVPGVGQQVALQLDPSTFKVVNNGNADNFDHPDTVILLYSNDKKTVSAGEQIKNELGVGRIEFRPPSQNVVDVTVVVGKDFKPE